MSGLMSAVGRGLSAVGYGAADLYAKSYLVDQQSEVEGQRQQRLLEFKATLDQNMADKARVDQNQRIEGRAGEIADNAVAGKRGLIDAGVADRSNWTPEQQAAVDQSLAMDRQAVASNPDVRLRAAADTGDLNFKEQAMLEREDRKLAQADRNAARKEAMDLEREDRRDARSSEAENRRDARLNASLAAAADRASRSEDGKPPKGYRWKADGTLEAVPGGPATIGKALPTKMVNDLTEHATLTDSSERFVNTFKPEYANHTIMGDASNTTKRVFGDETGQLQFWQDYALHEAHVRNKLFGASLTTGEQGAWQKLTITPRMDAAQVEQNLQRRAEIEKRTLDRLMLSSAKAGYNHEQIEAVTGRPIAGAATNSGGQPAAAGGSRATNTGGATGGWGIKELK